MFYVAYLSPQNRRTVSVLSSVPAFDPHYSVLLVERLTLIAVDILVVVPTWLKTHEQVRESRRLGISLPLSVCLIRDGA